MSYMNPLNKLIWQEAFKKKAKTVTIEGKVYDLTYFVQDGEEKVHWKVRKNFAPQGTMRLSDALSSQWLEAKD